MTAQRYATCESYDERRRHRNTDVGRCTAATFAPDLEYDDPVPPLMVQDGSDYQASLFTRRDFGCLLFQAEPGSEPPASPVQWRPAAGGGDWRDPPFPVGVAIQVKTLDPPEDGSAWSAADWFTRPLSRNDHRP